MLDKAMLYIRTVRRMRPDMVVARLRGQRRVSEHVFEGTHEAVLPRLAIPELDCEVSYCDRFDVDALLEDDFLLINERHRVDLARWGVPEASHLWNFNLHYFEYGLALAARWKWDGDRKWVDCFKRLVRAWIEASPYARGDAWHPYTISLRLINWLIAVDLFGGELQRDSFFFDTMRESMYRQYRHLLANQELHLRANHYWENVKTLVVCAVMFGERRVLARMLRCLEGQLDEQILPDGVHFERSLMYHKLVLEGMLRVWLAAGQLEFELPSNFLPKAKLMLDAMASLEKGMGKTPFFNDAADGVAKDCIPLEAACERLLCLDADDSKTVFEDAGYYKLYSGDIAVMFDAGEPGPSYMLGHAHCDCLSFELSYKGEPMIVNSGTYAYQSELRPYFRSTAAQSTVMVEGEEQMEYWGEHRVGRSIKSVRVDRVGGGSVSASLIDSRGNCLSRFITVNPTGIDVEDRALRGAIKSVVHIAPRHRAKVELICSRCEPLHLYMPYSNEFGCLYEAESIVMGPVSNVSLPFSIKVE